MDEVVRIIISEEYKRWGEGHKGKGDARRSAQDSHLTEENSCEVGTLAEGCAFQYLPGEQWKRVVRQSWVSLQSLVNLCPLKVIPAD